MIIAYIKEYDTIVTGHNGYIGKSFLKNLEFKECTLIGIKNATYLIHLASSVQNDSDSFLRNINTDIEIFEYCKLNNTKLIYASTNNVYPLKENCNIDTPKSYNDYYSSSKILSEELLQNFYNFDNVILRLGDVFGAGQKHGNFFRAIEESIRLKKDLKLYGQGLKLRNYIYIKDVVEFLLFSINNNFKNKYCYNICYEQSITINEIVTYISKQTNLNIINIDFEDNPLNIRTMNGYKFENRHEIFKYKYDIYSALNDYIGEIK